MKFDKKQLESMTLDELTNVESWVNGRLGQILYLEHIKEVFQSDQSNMTSFLNKLIDRYQKYEKDSETYEENAKSMKQPVEQLSNKLSKKIKKLEGILKRQAPIKEHCLKAGEIIENQKKAYVSTLLDQAKIISKINVSFDLTEEYNKFIYSYELIPKELILDKKHIPLGIIDSKSYPELERSYNKRVMIVQAVLESYNHTEGSNKAISEATCFLENDHYNNYLITDGCIAALHVKNGNIEQATAMYDKVIMELEKQCTQSGEAARKHQEFQLTYNFQKYILIKYQRISHDLSDKTIDHSSHLFYEYCKNVHYSPCLGFNDYKSPITDTPIIVLGKAPKTNFMTSVKNFFSK